MGVVHRVRHSWHKINYIHLPTYLPTSSYAGSSFSSPTSIPSPHAAPTPTYNPHKNKHTHTHTHTCIHIIYNISYTYTHRPTYLLIRRVVLLPQLRLALRRPLPQEPLQPVPRPLQVVLWFVLCGCVCVWIF